MTVPPAVAPVTGVTAVTNGAVEYPKKFLNVSAPPETVSTTRSTRVLSTPAAQQQTEEAMSHGGVSWRQITAKRA